MATRIVAAVIWIAFVLLLLVAVDRIAMHTVLTQQRAFLADIDHRPKPAPMEFNEDGIRDVRRRSAFRESDFNIVVLGDSFVFGFKLKAHEAIPQQLEVHLRTMLPERSINVANFGYLSASPYLSLRQLRDIGHYYSPDLILLCVDMTDFHDDIMYERYVERQGLFRMLDFFPSGFFAAKRLSRLLGMHEVLFGHPSDRFFVTHRPLDDTRGYLTHIQRNIDAIAEFSETELNARFALVILPRYFQYNPAESPNDWERSEHDATSPYIHEPFRYFEDIEAEGRYPVGSLLMPFQKTTVFPTVFDSDPHWNRQGVEIAVCALVEFLKEERLLEPGTPE